MKIDNKMAEKIATQTRNKNYNNKKRSCSQERVGLPFD